MSPKERRGFSSLRERRIDAPPLICPLEDYQGLSPRINGLQKLQSVGATTPNTLVLTDELFRVWKKNDGSFPLLVTRQLKREFSALSFQFPGKGLHIGRAFFVPGVDEPQGPRTADIHNANSFVDELNKFYRFIVEDSDGYDREGAEIALVTHQFMNTEAPPMQQKPLKPYPGGAAFLDDDGKVEIRATFGQDEAVQSFPHDEYYISWTTDGFQARIQPHTKNSTLLPRGGKYVRVKLAKSVQKEQALDDHQIMMVATILRRLAETHEGERHRVEFIGQPEGLVFRECVPFPYSEKTNKEVDVEGPVMVINKQSKTEIANLLQPHTGKDLIVYVHPELVERREFDKLATLGNTASIQKTNLTVLVWGSFGATAHRVRNLKDLGYEVKFVGNEVLDDGEIVHVYTKDHELKVEKDPTKPFSPENRSRSRFGGKVAGVEKLMHEGFTVPSGFKVDVSFFRQHVEECDLSHEFAVLERVDASDIATIEPILTSMREKILSGTLSPKLLQHMTSRAESVPGDELSIRSSANCEDAEGSSFAGFFESCIGVNKHSSKDVEDAIKKVFASVFTLNVFLHAEAKEVPFEAIEMGLLCHEKIDAAFQGTLYTNEDGKFIIEVGTERDVVEGGASQIIRIDRQSHAHEHDTREELKLDEKTMVRLVAEGLDIEKRFGRPQDVEWAITQDGKIVFLQSRALQSGY